MAITRASDLAAVGSGLGANPAQPINIGAAVTISGSAGVITATTFSGNATGLGGEPSIVVDSVRASDESTFLGGLKVTGVTTSSQGFSGNITGTAATFSGNVIVGGVLTYEDVTNIDSIGIITARSDVSIADKIIHTGDTNTAIRFPQSDTFTVETAGSERLRIGPTGISTFTGNISLTAGGAERLNLAHVSGGDVLIKNPTDAYLAFGTNNIERLRVTSDGKVGINSASPHQALDIGGTTVSLVKFTPSNYGSGASDGAQIGVNFGGLDVWQFENNYLRLGTNNTERLRITSGGGFHFTNGELIERAKVTAGKLSDNTNIDLENGMVHLFTTQETTTSTPNIRINSSTSLNSVMATGEMISVTLITTAAAGAYSAQLTIDGGAVTENWTGGSAPDAGGSSGVDIHAYTIIKTADATFTVVATQTTTS